MTPNPYEPVVRLALKHLNKFSAKDALVVLRVAGNVCLTGHDGEVCRQAAHRIEQEQIARAQVRKQFKNREGNRE